MKRKAWICCILAICLLAGCASNAKAEYMDAPQEMWSDAIYDGADMAEKDYGVSEKPEATTGGSNQGSSAATAQKLIRTMDMTVETDDLDALLGNLDAKIRELGGYLENKSVRNGGSSSTRRYRYADLKIRVPVVSLDTMVEHIQGKSNVVNYTEKADDITLTYVATQSRVKALEVEQTRLLELLAKADNMSDLLQIEQRLTNVRTELEEVASRLKLYDNLVDYGTITLSITEVQEFTVIQEETVWQRIGTGLRENWKALCNAAENIFVFLVSSVPYLIPLGIAGGITVVAVKAANRKKPEKKDPPEK